MNRHQNTIRSNVKALAGLIPALICTSALTVQAQEPAPAPVAPAPVVEPAPIAPPPPDVVVAPEPIAEPIAVVEPPPAEEPAAEEAPSPISVNAWMHLSLRLQGSDDPESPDNLIIDLGEVDLLFNADITDSIGLTADFVGDISGGGSVGILDLIGRFAIADAFNIWAGRMLVPSDRSNFSGFWFANPWYYPGFFIPGAAPFGPRQGPFGRNDGVTVWGQFAGGLFKYYLSIFELTQPADPLLFSSRLNLSLLSPEPGYYHSSTYLGEKDILAIGVGFQYEKDGSSTALETDDYTQFNADILFEKAFDQGAFIGLQGAFYLPMGEGEVLDNQFFVEASYTTGKPVGAGRIQPLIRLQMANPKADGADTWTLLDAQLGYIISGYAARLALGYQYSDAPAGVMEGALLAQSTGHAIYLGVQLQK
jgi:hypothetical protein